jgi:hypothetical protein
MHELEDRALSRLLPPVGPPLERTAAMFRSICSAVDTPPEKARRDQGCGVGAQGQK